jgi:hypothetical protein
MNDTHQYRKSPQALALNIGVVWSALVFSLVLLNVTLSKILVVLQDLVVVQAALHQVLLQHQREHAVGLEVS